MSKNTEARNPKSKKLDQMSAVEIIRLMDEDEQIVLQAVARAETQIAEAAEMAAQTFIKGGRVIYVGAGTSGRIATMDAAEMPPTFGLEPDRFVALVSGGAATNEKAQEDAEDDPHAAISDLNRLQVSNKDIVIGLAASGKTPYVLAAIRHARQKGVWTCGIVNNPNTPIEAEANLGIVLRTGPEILTGSTRLKAGTSQKLVLNRISTAAMVLAGKVVENLMVDVKAKNGKLKERCVRIVRDLSSATEDEAREHLEANDWNIRAVLDLLREPARA
ncbi:MAG: N-acetylmuramic acid 6-phosphate etherase [Fimbriimonadaceae bacterium]